MKIKIKSEGHAFTLCFPTRLLCSPTAIRLFSRSVASKTDMQLPNIPPEAVKPLYREIKRAKQQHPDWCLVDVESAKGDIVQIQL